jgi:predicted DNA-binding antitoxin AbrB/MazE fold protein
MKTITAIYENGVVRPTEPVDLPPGTSVRLEVVARGPSEAPPVAELVPPGTPEGLARIYEVLSRRYDSGHPDTAEQHNEHQP